jgi:dCMP deaminase|tara:strand:+ start:70 stop:534 length:465 start_codon:yes stop_codon:yes gene_type:complete
MDNYRPPTDFYFLRMAMLVAERGTCARRKVGSILINKKNHVIATGYNGNPSGFKHCIDKPCPGANSKSGTNLDKCEAIHAEQNALLQCKNVYDIDRVYTTLEPCIHCVKLLLNTSTQQIIYGEKYVHDLARNLWESSGRGYTYINKKILLEKTN